MIKSISNFAVKNPVTITMLVLATVLLGYISFNKLGIDLFPNLNNPRLFIEVKSGERPPDEMEKQYVDRIEALAIRQNGVVDVTSTSRIGVARIEVKYTWSKDMDEAFLDLSKALSAFNQDQNLDELNVTQYDPNSRPVMLIALQYEGETNLNELRKVAENYIRNDLIRLEGIADAEIEGAESQEVVIETNEYLMKSYGVTMSSISSKIKSFNQNISGGSVVEMGRRYIVKGLSELNNLSDLENIIVSMQNPVVKSGQTDRVPVLLKDVAKVYFGNKDKTNMVFLNGAPCIGMSVYKETKFNTVKAVDELRSEISDLQRALPGYRFTIIQDQGKYINSAIGEVSNSALIGMFLAVCVLLFFLRRIGPTAIVSVAIPISILAAFTLMYFNNMTLNIMSLGGLALAAGRLIDDAIVVIENIFRIHEEGESANNSAISGTSQVGGAITASTLTTIVVFLPIVYIQGASGELFKEQALTVTFSLLSSLVVAVMVVPMLYVLFYKKNSPFGKKNQFKPIKFTGYGRFLSRILDQRKWVILGSLLLLLAGWFMMKSLGSEFMPKTETHEFYVDLRMPEGTRLERTNGAVMSIENSIRGFGENEVVNIYTQVGPSTGLSTDQSFLFEDQNMATIKVFLDPNSKRTTSSFMEAIDTMYQNIPDVTVSCRQEETALQSILGTNEAPVMIELVGEDMEILEKLATEVMDDIKSVPGLVNIISSVEGGAPEVEIFIDRYRAGLMNLNATDIVNSVKEKLEGTNAGQMDVDGDLSDITLKLNKIGLSELKYMTINVAGIEVPLNEIAEIKTGNSPKEILHTNQNRVVRITAGIAGKIPLDKISAEIDKKLAGIILPVNYKYTISGQEAQRKESMRNLSFALILSLILVYMVLAAQFESLIHPFTILLTIPLALVGTFMIFFILGKPLNIMAFIGIIMLGGIAVTNSIILIDAIIHLRKEGFALKEAIVTAGMRRIRPILMTALTTILALVPLTFGFGESSALRSPMAWAVIGGLTTSTLLTLIVIPCVYLTFANIGIRKTEVKNE